MQFFQGTLLNSLPSFQLPQDSPFAKKHSSFKTLLYVVRVIDTAIEPEQSRPEKKTAATAVFSGGQVFSAKKLSGGIYSRRQAATHDFFTEGPACPLEIPAFRDKSLSSQKISQNQILENVR